MHPQVNALACTLSTIVTTPPVWQSKKGAAEELKTGHLPLSLSGMLLFLTIKLGMVHTIAYYQQGVVPNTGVMIKELATTTPTMCLGSSM
jgi:hypothetical protein